MLKLTIETGNSAFQGQCAEECARILEEIAQRLRSDLWNKRETVRDHNGNRCGEWTLSGDNVD